MTEILLPANTVLVSRARERWELVHRYRRLCKRANAARGTYMNLTWLHWSGLIFETLDALEALGVDLETANLDG